MICAVILSIGFGTLVGCSNSKENTESISEQPKEEAVQTEQSPVDYSSIENDTLENTTMLTFSKEGEQEGDLLYYVELKEFENNVWGIFYSYPSDAEEGFGRELPVIVNTFALSIEANDVDNEER